MLHGYQLIDVDFIDQLDIRRVPIEIQTSIVHWFVSILQDKYRSENTPVEVAVVIANYQGNYPCIGLRYLENKTPNLAPEVQQFLSGQLRGNYFSQYYQFLISDGDGIRRTIDLLKNG